MSKAEEVTGADASAVRRTALPGRLLIAVVFLTAMAAFFYFDLNRYVSFEAIKTNRARLLASADEHYAAAVVSFMAIYIVQTACALPGATMLSLIGGFLFGSLLATVYINVGATIGATLAFLGARYLFHDWVQQTFGHRLHGFQEGFAKNAFHYLLTLRLIPLFPFFLVNVLSGLTRVPTRTYVAATSLGIIPGSFVYTFAGEQLGTLTSPAEIASPRVLVALTLLGGLALVPLLYRKMRSAHPAT